MSKARNIRKIFKSKPTVEGAGVHLKRAFGFSEAPIFDPFLLLDDFRSNDPRYFIKGFPWHPHRGIETITYMLTGNVEHGDSMGNKGIIGPGDVQWMTAGNGIIHQEMPKGDSNGQMGGFQLWANLPSTHKMMNPRYRDIKSNTIPEVILENGVKIKIICGNIHGEEGPARDVVIEPEYLDISIPPNSEYIHPTIPGHTVFAYIIEGGALFCNEMNPYDYEIEGANYFDFKRNPLIDNESLILFEDGASVVITTQNDSARMLLISGKPIKEPIAWYGPIVMNTQEELRIAFEEFNDGTFIKGKNH